MSIQHKEIAAIREDYTLSHLSESEVSEEPISQFKRWFDDAINAVVSEPNAMVLSTVNPQHQPSSRVVLLKDIKENGFSFFTNYMSQKAQDIQHNSFVSLLFFWHELQRQVRVQGVIHKLPTEDSDEYFSSRPRGSQIGAIASPQSQIIADRDVLEQKVLELSNTYQENETIARPDHWGGYIVVPHRIEFWQGRSSRLHDRLVYELTSENQWTINRLAP